MIELPRRKTANGNEIDTRPMYVEEWLDTLPYIDFNKTAVLLQQALEETNKIDIKASPRLELIELYNRPYQYYVDSQIKAGAQHTLQSIEAMQQQLDVMKQIAVNLSYSCKLAFDKALSQKSLWGSKKPPVEALLMSIRYLSHALIFSYLEYSPVPKKVWQQLNFIYDLAASSGWQMKTCKIAGAGNEHIQTTIEHAYKRILMASLVDPHHLPFGAIWEIFEQLDSWADHTRLKPMQQVSNPHGYFVLELRSDSKPIPYKKFNLQKATKSARLLDTNPLENLIKQYVDSMDKGQALDDSIVLSPFYAKTLMAHMLSVWGLPPARHADRHAKKGCLKVASGMAGIYYFMNGNNAFKRPADDDDAVDMNVASEEEDDQVTEQFHYEDWRIVDEGTGGYALIRSEKPNKPVRVGELLGMNSEGNLMTLGVVRWLMISRQVHKVGIQNITHTARPIAIRACQGSLADKQFRPAFFVQQFDDPKKLAIVADKGLYEDGRTLEVNIDGKQKTVRAGNIFQSGLVFDSFAFSNI